MLQRFAVSSRGRKTGLQSNSTVQTLNGVSEGKPYLVLDLVDHIGLDWLHRLAVGPIKQLLCRSNADSLKVGISHQVDQGCYCLRSVALRQLTHIGNNLIRLALLAPATFRLGRTLFEGRATTRHPQSTRYFSGLHTHQRADGEP